jgi:catechol 2,3-dioxygenase-like lactoylglutathione lyase family enzyme
MLMKRFHIHVAVENINQSVRFYSTLFGAKPVKLKEDYAKWLLEDPRLNFAISTRSDTVGVNHLGIQVENEGELEEITERLKKADLGVYGEGETTCCYAESKKAWIRDPANIPWEAYQNMADAEVFGEESNQDDDGERCCEPSEDEDAGPCCG